MQAPFRVIKNAVVTAGQTDMPSQTFYADVYDSDGIVQQDLRRIAGKFRYADVPMPDPANLKRIKKAIFAGHFHGHFGHFLVETLPSAAVAARARTDANAPPVIFHNFQNNKLPKYADYRADLLNTAFGIDIDDAIILDADVVVDELIVFPRPVTLQGAKINLDFADDFQCGRNRFLERNGLSVAKSPERVVYLSRQTEHAHSSVRRRGSMVLREKELEAELVKRGVEIVIPEQLPMPEQLKMFAESKAIIAIAGSGLHNIIWCRPGTHMIELPAIGRRNLLIPNFALAAGAIPHRLEFGEIIEKIESEDGSDWTPAFRVDKVLQALDPLLAEINS